MKKTALFLTLIALCAVQFVYAQGRQITGTVLSGDDGLSLPGVSIVVKGTTIGTVTDFDGNYTLSVSDDAKVLVFSFIGMTNQEIEITTNVIDVTLESQSIGVDEVVVTAMGIKKEKKALGYSVQDVNSEEIGKTGNADLAGAIQGKVAGVDIKPSSGMPGASSQINIRGSRSFSGNNTPLYVVDGMPISSTAPFSTGSSVSGADIANRAVDIDPSDIASINILKGQAAAALYGIRASNGVVIITTKSGKAGVNSKPVVNLSHTSSFDVVSRTPDFQKTYAQGNNGAYVSNTSMSWGSKIEDLPNDPTYGGNGNGNDGKYYVPQLAQAGLDPWQTPSVYNNWDDYFKTGYTATTSASVTKGSESGTYALSLGNSTQDGIALNTDMQRWNAKVAGTSNLSDNFTTGFTANVVELEINKLTSGNDAALAGVMAAPASYNLAGTPFHDPSDQYSQIYYRSLTFDNPYWIAENNIFNEQTIRFFGNAYLKYDKQINEDMMFNIKYQIGLDTYTTHYQDIFEYGSGGDTGNMENYGATSNTLNSLATAFFDWGINDDLHFNLTVGNEVNHNSTKTYSQYGENFNFGGWAHINNANTVTVSETQFQDRTVGFFASASLDYDGMLFLNVTGRNDYVSSMPSGNRSFFYPSTSLGFVASELEALKDISWLSFAKGRFSYAEVGQAGDYLQNYYEKPVYGGGFWKGEPVQYPVDGVNAYIPSNVLYDPNLKPQNTQSFEVGVELKFLNNRLGVDYTYSRQNVSDQIFNVPLAASSGASELVMNGGELHTDGHEMILYMTPVKKRDFTWDMNVNFTRIISMVDELAPGVESIFLGGFVTPQVRASAGHAYPVIYGGTFVRHENGGIVIDEDPTSPGYGMPLVSGEPGVIGDVSPDFILGGTSTFTYKHLSLSAVMEWKQGGEMYSGSNGLLDIYGMSSNTEDRTSTFLYDGVKADGSANDIVRGGADDPNAYQYLYSNVLGDIDEYFVRENSFLKLREVSLKYAPSKKIADKVSYTVSAFSRNILLWTALDNFDPESSQGNNNMGGSFERFSMPQTTSYGVSMNFTF